MADNSRDNRVIDNRTLKRVYKIKHRNKISIKSKSDIDDDGFINDIFPKLCGPYRYKPAIMDARPRIVVFGDIHGDYNLMLDMFIKANLVSYDKAIDKVIWKGGDTFVVQVGDQIDRCRPLPGLLCDDPKTTLNDEDHDIKIMKTFNELHLQAEKEGGAVISLLGNHELLNVMGRMDYVSYKGLQQFENYVDPENPNKTFKSGKEARIHAFKPGKEYARMMGCTRYPAVIIGSNIFVHAGIVDGLIDEIKLTGMQDFEKINIKIKRWLLGMLDSDYVEDIIKQSNHSMFWTRILGKIPPGVSLSEPECMDNIKEVLRLFQVGSIIVGHTPQSFLYSDDINSTCSGKVWRVDNGSSSAFNKFDVQYRTTGSYVHSRRTQYLEIIDDNQYFVCDGSDCKREIRT